MDPMSEPYVAMQTVMMPRDANPQGTIFGGVILSLIDMAAYVGAKRLVLMAGGRVPMLVTVAINRVEFHQPVFVGDVVRCLVRLVRFGRTSVTVLVTVEAERGTATHKVTEAEVVYVGVDPTSPDRRPTPLLPG
ncbi:MAG TPA: hotdog domain-containing protein [Gemmataceae bacterium]|jgi:acyl-CoA thioesterase YciA|nr:hotdog domain-containing protein [Gemmataceae bacterium]